MRKYGENKNFVIYIEIFPESYFLMYIYIFWYIFIVIFLNVFTKWIIYKMYKHSMKYYDSIHLADEERVYR